MPHIPTESAEHARLRTFQAPLLARAVWQVASTFALYAALTVAMYFSVGISVWLTLLLALPASGLIVRIFMFQHDCGHNSFFPSARHNRMLGRVCSLVTLTPFAYWKRLHARHHGDWSNLDNRGIPADFYSDCLTLAEYRGLSRFGRWLYRISHHPALIHVLLPPVIFILMYRMPFDTPASCKTERRSVYALNLGLVLVFGGLACCFGLKTVMLVQLPAMALSAIMGIWLFSVQHRFEDAQWYRKADWTLADAALHGSSYLKLPRLLRWFTADIGVHHVHHLRPSIPNYRLAECHEACLPMTAAVSTITFADALKAPSFLLWDEEQRRMVPFPA